MKLTWDEDDAERNQITRRALTKELIDKGDFTAYLASSSESECDPRAEALKKKKNNSVHSRDKLRALLLGGNDDKMPEGWDGEDDADPKDVDMEITFTSGFSNNKKAIEDENTLETYERKKREKRKKRKDEFASKSKQAEVVVVGDGIEREADDFFDDGSGAEDHPSRVVAKTKSNKPQKPPIAPWQESTAEELALIVASDNLHGTPDHFDMKAVVKAEKKRSKGKRATKSKDAEADVQSSFKMDLTDERFKAIHEDHMFAIDPSNPQYVPFEKSTN